WGTWGDMLVGDDNQMDEDQPGNQLATVDLRWGDTAWGVPYGIYWQSMGEDSFSPERFPPFQEMSYLYGADVSYELMNQSITNFIEYSETEPNCGDDLGDCAYEHHIYKSGYRYKARSLGSTYDNDAHTYTLGFIGRNNQNTQNWFVALRYLELNRDDSNKNDPGGNTVSASAEDIFQMEMTYQMPFWVGELETGLIYNNISPKHGNSDETLDVWAQWQYQF
ncbi:MAG: capsule assembly Wzi family protein, partial [Vibrio sp.]